MDNAQKAQAVINTMEKLMIPATYDNVNRMLGIYQTMFEIRDSARMEKTEEEAVTEDG